MFGRLTIIDGSPERVELLPAPQEQSIEDGQIQQAEETGGGRVVSIDRMEVVNVLYEQRGD